VSGQIFISYRREDGSASAGRLSDRLSNHFPSNQIFMDVDSVDLGEDFVKKIEETVGSCDVLIAVIGKGWLTACDQEGQRRQKLAAACRSRKLCWGRGKERGLALRTDAPRICMAGHQRL
jgi:hypothetical protein